MMKRKIVSVFLVGALALTLLCGCQGQGGRPSEEKKQVDDALEAVLENKKDGRMVNTDGSSVSMDDHGDMAQVIMEQVSYEILSAEGDMTAEVAFTYPDVMTMLDDFAQNYDSALDVGDWLEEAFEEDFPQLQETVEVSFAEEDGELALVMDEAMLDILTGGIYSGYWKAQMEAYEAYREDWE